MRLRRLLALAVVFALMFVVSGGREAATAEAQWYEGEVTNFIGGICYWHCYGGPASSAPASNARQCMNICAADCSGPCLALY
jgi:hypothetical protein